MTTPAEPNESNHSGEAMNRDEVLNLLRAHKPALAERFGVTELALFGSFARDQATDRSDVDILVVFDGPATSKSYFGVQFYIEDLLGRPVDLVTGFASGDPPIRGAGVSICVTSKLEIGFCTLRTWLNSEKGSCPI